MGEPQRDVRTPRIAEGCQLARGSVVISVRGERFNRADKMSETCHFELKDGPTSVPDTGLVRRANGRLEKMPKPHDETLFSCLSLRRCVAALPTPSPDFPNQRLVPSMRIGINILFLIPGVVGGTEVYARGLIEDLVSADGRNEYFVFVNRETELNLPATLGRVRVVRCYVRARWRVLRYLWEQLILPFQVLYLGIDILHSLGYVGPLLLGRQTRSILTIHDLNPYYMRRHLGISRRTVLWAFVKMCSKRADAIITGSETVKSEIVRVLGIPEERVFVIYHTPTWLDGNKGSAREGGAKRSGEVYFVAMSSEHRHKNIDALLRAMSVFARCCGTKEEVRLLILGNTGRWGHQYELLCRELGIEKVVSFEGYLRREEKDQILVEAGGLVFPSLYEGFGLPILEAFRLRIPLLCSDIEVFREIAGEGALYFDPLSPTDIAAKMLRIVSDPELVVMLGEKAERRLAFFLKRQPAVETVKVYGHVGGR